jgi:predicted NodU family carbamoyl transferase
LGACDPRAAEAAAAYFGGPFPDAAVVVLADRRASCALAHAGGIEPLADLAFDGDLASLFAAAQRHAGTAAVCFGGADARDRAANGAVRRHTDTPLWMNPAAGAGAAALGAAILGAMECAQGAADFAIRTGSPAVGPAYNAAQIRTFLRSQGILLEEAGRDEAPAFAAERLLSGERLVWFDGRLDFDEDAAASRSILRAVSPDAPVDAAAGEVVAIAAERAHDIFEGEGTWPALVDAVVRPAWRARFGIAGGADHALPVAPIAAEARGFRALLATMEQRGGCPAVVARALRLPSGPVACAPHDAWAARDVANASTLVLGPYVLVEFLTKQGAAREIADSTPSGRSPE